jgi:hypothetical protein
VTNFGVSAETATGNLVLEANITAPLSINCSGALNFGVINFSSLPPGEPVTVKLSADGVSLTSNHLGKGVSLGGTATAVTCLVYSSTASAGTNITAEIPDAPNDILSGFDNADGEEGFNIVDSLKIDATPINSDGESTITVTGDLVIDEDLVKEELGNYQMTTSIEVNDGG